MSAFRIVREMSKPEGTTPERAFTAWINALCRVPVLRGTTGGFMTDDTLVSFVMDDAEGDHREEAQAGPVVWLTPLVLEQANGRPIMAFWIGANLSIGVTSGHCATAAGMLYECAMAFGMPAAAMFGPEDDTHAVETLTAAAQELWGAAWSPLCPDGDPTPHLHLLRP